MKMPIVDGFLTGGNGWIFECRSKGVGGYKKPRVLNGAGKSQTLGDILLVVEMKTVCILRIC